DQQQPRPSQRLQMPALARPGGGPPPIQQKAERRVSSRNVIPRGHLTPPPALDGNRDRASTAQMDPLEAQKLAAIDLPPVPVLSEATRATARSTPVPVPAAATPEGRLDPFALAAG